MIVGRTVIAARVRARGMKNPRGRSWRLARDASEHVPLRLFCPPDSILISHSAFFFLAVTSDDSRSCGL